MNPGTAAPTHPPRLTPTKAEALRSTTLANTWQSDLGHPTLRSQLAAKFGSPSPPPNRFVPRA
jgi:hypothetical protein